MNYIFRSLFILSILTFPNMIYSQERNAQEKIISKLANEGFENVSLLEEKNKLFITFENRLYRFEPDGFIKVINLITPFISENIQKVIMILLHDQIPLISLSLDADKARGYLEQKLKLKQLIESAEISISTDETWEKISNLQKFNRSTFKFDIVFRPQIKAEFGDYDNPIQYQLNIIPGISTSWWKGMNVTAEAVLPIHNEFGEDGDYIRPGILSLNQMIRLPDDFFISATAGYFSENRYGFDFEVRKLYLNGNLSVGGNLGYTGFASVFKNEIFYSNIYLLTGFLSFNFRVPEYDLTLGLTAGKFLYEDESIRLDINRQFGEVSIGFFIIKSRNGDSNGGFNFSIPIFPSEYSKPNLVRIKPVKYFPWEYKVRGLTPGLMAFRYKTGYNLTDLFNRVNPSFIINYFKRE